MLTNQCRPRVPILFSVEKSGEVIDRLIIESLRDVSVNFISWLRKKLQIWTLVELLFSPNPYLYFFCLMFTSKVCLEFPLTFFLIVRVFSDICCSFHFLRMKIKKTNLFLPGSHAISSTEVEQHLEMGKKLLAAGQLAEALQHYHSAVGQFLSFS